VTKRKMAGLRFSPLFLLWWASLVLMAGAIPMPKALSAAGIEEVMGRPGGASDGSNVPEQVHIIQGKHPGSLIIGWATQGKGVPVVRYGLKSGAYEWKALGTTETYVRGNYTSPHIHHAKVSCNAAATTRPAAASPTSPLRPAFDASSTGPLPDRTPDGPRMGETSVPFIPVLRLPLMIYACDHTTRR